MPRIVLYADAQVGDIVFWQTPGGLYMWGRILSDEDREWLLAREPYGGVCSLPKDPASALVHIDQHVERPNLKEVC